MIAFNQHHPVMLTEIVTALNIVPDGIYIDGTFGRGGHSREILRHLSAQGRLLCFDKDPQAIAYAHDLFAGDERVMLFHHCFSELLPIIQKLGLLKKINGILLDLGVSSPQLDEAARGFSFMREGPLDMRMDPTQGLSASEWLNQATQAEITTVLKRYGEEAFASKIAKKIIATREQKAITTTTELAHLIETCGIPKKPGRHPATKTFQGIRIYINQELQSIDKVLIAAHETLTLGGRLVAMSFHSLEDRKVKQYIQSHAKIAVPRGMAILEKDLIAPFKWINKRQKPSLAEITDNPRARSATLRVAEKNTY